MAHFTLFQTLYAFLACLPPYLCSRWVFFVSFVSLLFPLPIPDLFSSTLNPLLALALLLSFPLSLFLSILFSLRLPPSSPSRHCTRYFVRHLSYTLWIATHLFPSGSVQFVCFNIWLRAVVLLYAVYSIHWMTLDGADFL